MRVSALTIVATAVHLNYAGDLDNIIRKQRAKEAPLPEKVLKKWFGQMVEALAFVHSKSVRDLCLRVYLRVYLRVSVCLCVCPPGPA